MGDADTTDIDFDALWETTVWEEIEEIVEVEGEVEQVVSVAGVRGEEAEDEVLEHLYYRKSMKRIPLSHLQNMLGKLISKKDRLKKDGYTDKLNKVNQMIIQIEQRIKKY